MFGSDFLIVNMYHLSYLAIFLIIIASGFGIPFPEDAILLLSGYLASIKILKLKWAILVCIVGLIMSDNIGFYIGRRGGKIVERVLSSDVVKHYGKFLCRRRTIFLTRFLSGIRVFFPIAAGAANMEWKKFFVADTSAIFVLGIGLNLVGYYFGWAITPVIKQILKLDKIVGIIFAVVLVLSLVLIFFLRKKYKGKVAGRIHDKCVPKN